MMTSTTAHNPHNKASSISLWAVLLWLVVWQLGSMALGQELLLPSPVSALLRLFTLAGTAEFWHSLSFSACRILGGFLLAVLAAVPLAALSARFLRIRQLLAPAVAAVKAVPVASFIILAFLWLPSKQLLALFIAFLMVFPPVYGNLLEGICQIDPQLLEMAQVFRVPFFRRLWGIGLPQVLPYFRAACSLSLGLCWKAGVAAEVIGVLDHSIGGALYQSKIYFEMTDLFAWTISVVAISVLFEKLVLFLLDQLSRRLGL